MQHCPPKLQAAVYAKMCDDLWRSVPGALDFLKKMYHTQVGNLSQHVQRAAAPEQNTLAGLQAEPPTAAPA